MVRFSKERNRGSAGIARRRDYLLGQEIGSMSLVGKESARRDPP